jgi:hypothetical protein
LNFFEKSLMLWQKKESGKRQALKEIHGNRIVDSNITDFKNWEFKKESAFIGNRDLLRKEVIASRMIIIKQQNEINSLRKQVAFLKLSTTKEPSTSQDQNVTSNTNYATPKKRRLDNNDSPSSAVRNDENDPRTPNARDASRKTESKKSLLSAFPPKPPLSGKRYQLEDSPPKRPSSSSEQNFHFDHFNKLLDQVRADDSRNPSSPTGMPYEQAAKHTTLKPLSSQLTDHFSPNVIGSPSIHSISPSLNDNSTAYSPYSMGKKNMFLSNITRQYGPVSMTGLPAYKDKISTWKSKYYDSST